MSGIGSKCKRECVYDRALSGQLNVADVSVGEILVNGESVDPRSQDYRRYTRYLSSRGEYHRSFTIPLANHH